SNNDDRLTVDGAAKQLKMVIEPEQVEYFAQRATLSTGTNAQDRILAGAAELLTRADSATAFSEGGTTYKVVDLASKIVGYETSGAGRVTAQYLQSGCACSGAGHGVKNTFEYTGPSGYPTCKVTTYTFDGS